MLYTSHSLLRLANERTNELRRRAAHQAVVAALNAEKRRARREAALAAVKDAIAAKEERATYGWQSQRRALGFGRLNGAR